MLTFNAPPLPFRHLEHRLSDPEQFANAVTGVSLVADFLAPQRLPTFVEQFQSPAWALDYHEAHVKARVLGPLPPGWVSFGLMRSAADSSWYGAAAMPGTLACTPPGEVIDGRITPGFECCAVSLPLAAWEKCRALSGRENAAFSSAVALHLPPAVYTRIDRQLRATRRLLREAEAAPHLAAFAAQQAVEFAMHIGTSAWELSDPADPLRESLRNRARLARRAEAWMREHLAEPVRVPDLCLALRVSRRELEYAFRVTFDESPRDYLHALRLNAIHRTLRRHAPRETLLKTLLDHGLTHPGRFSAEYQALFGEKPSQTRAGASRLRDFRNRP